MMLQKIKIILNFATYLFNKYIFKNYLLLQLVKKSSWHQFRVAEKHNLKIPYRVWLRHSAFIEMNRGGYKGN